MLFVEAQQTLIKRADENLQSRKKNPHIYATQ